MVNEKPEEVRTIATAKGKHRGRHFFGFLRELTDKATDLQPTAARS